MKISLNKRDNTNEMFSAIQVWFHSGHKRVERVVSVLHLASPTARLTSSTSHLHPNGDRPKSKGLLYTPVCDLKHPTLDRQETIVKEEQPVCLTRHLPAFSPFRSGMVAFYVKRHFSCSSSRTNTFTDCVIVSSDTAAGLSEAGTTPAADSRF